jgi:hypothetical protein
MRTESATQRISKRTYPPRKCVHCGDSYIPHDYRQLYCCEQHRIDANNDKRREENHTRFINEKKLRRIEKTLETLALRMKSWKIKTITIRDLLLAGIDRIDILVEQAQSDTNELIHWFYDFGIQAVNKEATEFKIIKR